MEITNKTIVLAKDADKQAFMTAHGIGRMVLNMSDTDENGELDIWIDETIGMWDTDASIFRSELQQRDAKVINLHIASGGGFLNDAITIYHLLKDHSADVNAYLQGTVASAATVIALAADKIYASNYAQWLVHNPSSWASGDYRDMQSTMDMLRKYRDTLAKMYNTKTGKSMEELYALMDEDRIMDASEAKKWGFVDGLFEPSAGKTKKKRMRNIFELVENEPPPNPSALSDAEVMSLQIALTNLTFKTI